MFRCASVSIALALLLSACGSTSEDRTISGAGIGAGAGALIGAVTGLSILEGALIGTAAGGAAGLFTDQEDVDLGDPLWRSSDNTPNGQISDPTNQNTLVASAQSSLAQLGYNPGPADGLVGPMTTDAIRQYQADHGLLVDGRVTTELVSHMRQGA